MLMQLIVAVLLSTKVVSIKIPMIGGESLVIELLMIIITKICKIITGVLLRVGKEKAPADLQLPAFMVISLGSTLNLLIQTHTTSLIKILLEIMKFGL